MSNSTKKKSVKKTVKKKKAAAKKAPVKKAAPKKAVSKKPVVKSAAKKTVKKKSVQKKSSKASIGKKTVEKRITTKAAAKKTVVPKKIRKKSLKARILEKDNKQSKKDIKKVEDEYGDEDAYTRGDTPMTVVGHLDELRSRLLVILGIIIVLTCVALYFSDYLLEFISSPFIETGNKLNIFKLTGGFLIRIKVSVMAAILVSMPLIIHQVWRFILPAISTKERLFSRLSVFSSVFLFYAGIGFVFFGLLPFAIKMMLSFISQEMLSTIGANDYISFILLFCLIMGILFELPIFVMILTRIGLLTPQFLIQKRKYSIVMIFIIAAVITPQDPFTQIAVAIPLMFLYELSIVVSKVIMIRKKKNELMNT